MKRFSSNGWPARAFSSEELYALGVTVHQSADDARFDKKTIARLLATIDASARNRRGAKTKGQRRVGAPRTPELRRQLAKKELENGRLHSAIRRIGEITGQIVPKNEQEPRSGGAGPDLPPTQRFIFEEVCKGSTPLDIAKALNRSRYTVKNHLNQILKTFGVKNRVELVAKALGG
jgi:DNA-binding CsgD family transcriptional regulator